MTPRPARLAVLTLRHGIDRIDDAILRLAAARRSLVHWLEPLKREIGAPARDLPREQAIRFRTQVLAHRLRLPRRTADQLLQALIRDAWVQQGIAQPLPGDHCMQPIDTTEFRAPVDHAVASRVLRLVPPPKRLAPLVKIVPRILQARALEALVGRALAELVRTESFAFLEGRRVGIEAADLGVAWVFVRRHGALFVCDEAAEATVRGSVTDLLLLASRLEDADTLFFQRRLVLTGDTELGLTARNVLDRMPWDAVPLGARIVLNRLARFARRARAAHRANAGDVTTPSPASAVHPRGAS